MQRTTPDGIEIACDFCGTAWDQVAPMIEGHHGSVLCLACLERGLEAAAPSTDAYSCTLCLRKNLPAGTDHWRHPDPPPAADPSATVCGDCLDQAARAFDRDPDVDWTRPK